MPSLKNPCVECKARHLRCNDDTIECRRCQSKGLQCVRPGRNRPFRHGSSAKYDTRFSESQNWVETNVREFRLQITSRGNLENSDAPELPEAQRGCSELASESIDTCYSPSRSPEEPHMPSHSSSDENLYDHTTVPLSTPSAPVLKRLPQLQRLAVVDKDQEVIQEACLLRYFIEELSRWFDLCDPWRRFHLLIPERAIVYEPLRHAILAVSARHLCRAPRYQTPEGIVYHGFRLPLLNEDTAIEYMLKCMPVLREYHSTPDEEVQESIFATAVILRQFEEMDDEDEDVYSTRNDDHDMPTYGRVSFLDIINTVLRSSNWANLFRRKGLLDAAYWIALRQELYYTLRKGYSPQMIEPPGDWNEISPANKLVLHTNQVAKWLFDDKSKGGWSRLKDQETYLEQHVASCFPPLLSRLPDRAKGEVFPILWYRSDVALTAMQHLMIAKMILLADSPFLRDQADARQAYRRSEGEVRKIILDICGSALQHLDCPPGLVNALVSIRLYGHYFVDPWERKALGGIIQKFKDVRAWPLPSALQSFQ